uniref:FAT atypical cadherin 3b n=1 Tax=Poecilia formosa TaxID=48698 RepID=A0A087YI97_POEFO
MNREVQDNYTLTVKASSHTGLEALVTIFIKVLDTNDLRPLFSPTFYSFVVSESALLGTSIGRVTATDADIGSNGEFYYFFKNRIELFAVHPTSGVITLTGRPRIDKRERFELEVQVVDRGMKLYGNNGVSSTARLVLTVDRVNEFAPVLSAVAVAPSLIVKVSEVAPPGTIVEVVKISPAPLSVNYSFRSLSDPMYFDINPLTGIIMTIRQLTKISQDFMEMEVVDYVSQQQARVQINIEDANDNSPVFSKPSYDIAINESLPVGTVVLVVSAVDSDKGENGYVTHTINGEESIPFSIDQDTGELTITRDLDFESSEDIYIFAVRASDWGSPYRRETEVNVTIRVVNINDNKPAFEKVSCRGILVREDLSPGSSVFQVRARDADIGFNGRVLFSIYDGNKENSFNINMESGLITVLQPLDRERQDRYFLNITIYDQGIPQMSNWRLLTVIIEDANDNNPQFYQDSYSAIVSENADLGMEVIAITAFDRDIGQNGQFSFRMLTSVPQFGIDSETGSVFVASQLDREAHPVFILKIEVRDKAERGTRRSSVTTLSIIVEDINDCSPAFIPSSYITRVPEDLPPGTVITWVQAQDPDVGPGGQVRYSLINDFNGTFEISAVTGILRINKELDFETKQFFNLTVVAEDRGISSLRSVTFVEIEVADVNENLYAPYFLDFAVKGSVKENSRTGTSVLTVIAKDDDRGRDGVLRYSVRGGSGLGTFTIDEDTALAYIQSWLNFKQKFVFLSLASSYLFLSILITVNTVTTLQRRHCNTVCFHSLLGRATAFCCTIKIIHEQMRTKMYPLDNTQSTFHPPKRHALALSNQVTAALMFLFSSTGVIYTAGNLDCETKNSYWLTVHATDRGVTPMSASVEVFIQVEDVNDNAPLTSDPIYHPVVKENSPKDVPVIRIQAQDPDLTAAPTRLSYRISAGNPQNFFSINPKTGKLIQCLKLDREHQAEHFLEVTVIDGPVTTRQSTVWVIVHIEDENDNSPTFPEVTYRISLPERDRNKRGEPVYRVFAYDRDLGANGNITYSIIDGNEDEKFSIDPRTGMVSSKKMVTAGSYDILTIKAEDSGIPLLWSAVKLHVEWIRKPVPSPMPLLFTQKSYNFSIAETSAVAQPVGVVAISQSTTPVWFSIVGKYINCCEIDPLSCKIDQPTSQENDKTHFDLQVGVGTLVVAKPLDAEIQSVYNMTVQVTDGTNFATTQVCFAVFIRVQDSNDNPPVFSQPAYYVSVSEDAPSDFELLRLRASDMDERARLSFSIYGSVDPASMRLFRVNPGTGVVYTADRLDYEARTQHILTIMVKDQEFPFNRDLARILVAVEDTNDNVPYFTSTVYDAVAYETFPVGTSVVQVTALDKDNGINGQITYTIEAGNTGGLFTINNTTGLIFIAKDLDLTSLGFYTLTVRAIDSGFPPLMATASVRISLMLSDFSKPQFSQKEYQAEIMENSKLGSYVTTLSALSRSPLIYDIVRGNEERCFFINHHTGVITTRKLLDFEQITSYFLMVRALSMAGVEASTSVIIQVVDVNDNQPEFQKISVVLGEDGNPLVIQATDKDRNHNSLLVFQIIEETARMFFSVDSGTGSIRTIASLDYETYPEFNFRVHVQDSGQPPKSADSPAEVIIKVINMNDSPPKFSQDTYETVLLLPTYVGVEVFRVEALDPDMTGDKEKSLTPKLAYSLVDNSVECFTVQRNTGVVTITNPNLSKDRYRFSVKVSLCQVSLPLNITSSLLYYVEDLNDNAPEFVNLPYYAAVQVEAEPGSAIFMVSAVDRDFDLNGEVTYSLKTQHRDFEMNPVTGELVLKRAFEADLSNAEYRLIIIAADGGFPRLSSEVELPVTVVNKAMPVFDKPFYGVTVREDVEVSTSVLGINASSPEGQDIIFTISDGDPSFQFDIGFDTGIISVRYPLDYETMQYYRLTVKATDTLTGAKSEVDVDIVVLDVNDNPPLFQNTSYSAMLSENSMIGTSVLQVFAPDQDSEKNAVVTYQILSDIYNSTDYFQIDSSRGLIFTSRMLDYELMQRHNFIVRATDSGDPALSTDVSVTVVVTDTNDNPPNFSQAVYEAFVSDLAPRGHFVTCLQASDADICDAQRLRYSILSGNEKMTFMMEPDTGVLRLSNKRRQGMKLFYQLNVSVSDGVFTNTAQVIVRVLGANLYSPVFSQRFYLAEVLENSPPGTKVIQVSAMDEDSGLNGQITYSFINDLGKINLGSFVSKLIRVMTDVILLKTSRGTVLSFFVKATDCGAAPKHSLVSAFIQVVPPDSFIPSFSQPQYSFTIPEDTAVGTVLGSVYTGPGQTEFFTAVPGETIDSNQATTFLVEKETGLIRLLKPLDYEEVSSFRFKYYIFVNKLHYSWINYRHFITLQILDVNDNKPEFETSTYVATVMEGMPSGTRVIQVRALDPDWGSNGQDTLSLTGPITTGSVFAIDSKTGWITTVTQMDHEACSSYSFEVVASDLAESQPLSSTTVVTITVSDVNDNPPRF